MEGEEEKLKTRDSYRIAYALAPKKVESVIQASLITHANSHGIHLIPLDPTKPLIDQYQQHSSSPFPFDCIIHKLYHPLWNHQLALFSAQFPHVPIVDPPDSIHRLHNRISMLRVVQDLNLPHPHPHPQDHINFAIPKQLAIFDSQTPLVTNHGLKFPLIAKPLLTNSKDQSHKMALVYDQQGLFGLNPPLVLQEFVNHGGVIFKVYVAGKHVECVKRHSLPDISEEKLTTLHGMLPFSQISNLAAHSTDIDKALMPPMDFVYDMANGLREALGLNLFNFDMIRDASNENNYLVIDINYFPGYAKIPSYETMLTNFFLDVVGKRGNVRNTSTKLRDC